jgi:hypothetical protein
VPLAAERRTREIGFDRRQQARFRNRWRRTAACSPRRRVAVCSVIE